MIDVDAPLPDDVFGRITHRSEMLNHSVSVDASRWQDSLSARDLDAPAGKLSERGLIQLSRSEVFSISDQEPSPTAAIQLLWSSLAWGLGLRAPRLTARLDAISADRDHAAALLAEAWNSIRTEKDPERAYSVLTTNHGTGRIKWLGPSFSTKFLYFAQGSAVLPTCVILDGVVATNLRPAAWPSAPSTAWWPGTYGAYCELMGNWADKAQVRSGTETSPDQIEFALFRG